jgi:hypothetical protein
MSLRKCHGTERLPFQRCVDSPYLEGEGPTLPTLPPNIELPIVNDQIMMGGDEGGIEDTPITQVKRSLGDWYISFWKKLNEIGIIPPSVECKIPSNKSERYSCWSNMQDSRENGRRFTALFVCPLTGEKFLSGKLANEEDWTVNHMYYDETSNLLISNIRFGNNDINPNEGDGVNLPRVDLVWYTTKSKAEEAAAGRALDCLRHRAAVYTGDETYQRNLCCTDEPYLQNEAPGAWNEISDSVVAAEDMIYHRNNVVERSYVSFWTVLEEERITSQFNVDDFHSLPGDNDDEWRRSYRQGRT